MGGDNSEQYGYQGSIIPFLFQPIFIIGIAAAIKKSQKENIWRLLLFCSIAILLFRGILTVNPYPPFLPCLVGNMPFVFFYRIRYKKDINIYVSKRRNTYTFLSDRCSWYGWRWIWKCILQTISTALNLDGSTMSQPQLSGVTFLKKEQDGLPCFLADQNLIQPKEILII